MRILVALTGAVFAATVLMGQDTVQPSPPPVNPICEWAFRQAEQQPRPSPDPVQAMASSDQTAPVSAWPGGDYLDEAIRMCASVTDFAAGAALHPDALLGTDALTVVTARCSDASTGLSTYATCGSLVRLLATPPPSPIPTPSPIATPTPKPRPTPKPTAPPASAATAPSQAGLVRVPAVRAAVPGASGVRYFAVRGSTPLRLMRSSTWRAARFCGRDRRAMACVQTRPSFSPQHVQDPWTGSCTITSVRTSLVTVAYIPQWTAPRRVPAYLAWWWRKVIARVGWHEAQHVKIAKAHVARFPGMVVGRSCAKYGRLGRRWATALHAAQDAFDRLDYPRGDRLSARWMQQAYVRFRG